MEAVIISRDVGHLCEATVDGAVGLVHAAGHHAAGVILVAQGDEVLVTLHALGFPLLGNLVAHAPQDDAGMVAVVEHQVADVLLPPLVPIAAVAVAHLRLLPAVKALGHDHHAQAVADFHLHRRGHVVAGADGIGAHGLHHLNLADEGRLVDGGTQRAQVMVQAHALDLAAHAVELESTLLAERDSADSELGALAVHLNALVAQCGGDVIEIWTLGRPQRGSIHVKACREMSQAIGAGFAGEYLHSASIGEQDFQFKVIVDDGSGIQLMLDLQRGLFALDA